MFSMFRISYKSFILTPVAILCMIVPFVYKAGFDNTQYFTSQAFALPFIACGIALALSFLSARHGAVAMFIASFGSLLSFANASYLYLSSVFFSGIAGTLGGMLEQIGFHWAFCAIAFVVAMVVSIVTMFLPESSF